MLCGLDDFVRESLAILGNRRVSAEPARDRRRVGAGTLDPIAAGWRRARRRPGGLAQ